MVENAPKNSMKLCEIVMELGQNYRVNMNSMKQTERLSRRRKPKAGEEDARQYCINGMTGGRKNGSEKLSDRSRHAE